MSGEQAKALTITTATDIAKDFLLQEHQLLSSLQLEAKAVGNARLNFYVTFTTAVGSLIIAVQQFIVPETYIWLLIWGATIIMSVGLITFRKMLQRRVTTIIYRRRLRRIRAWFVKYDPQIAFGLPYDTNQYMSMDWGKNKLGSTAFSVAFINTALVTLAVAGGAVIAFGISSLWWVVPIAIICGTIIWWLHLLWKNRWIEAAEARDRRDLQALDEFAEQFQKSQ